MNISQIQELKSSAVPVLVLKSDKKAGGHPFYKNLFKEDSALVARFIAKTPLDKEAVYPVFLPSGGRILIVGAGDKQKFAARNSVLAMRKIVAAAKADKIKSIKLNAADFTAKGFADESLIAETLGIQLELANYDHVAYKTKPKEGWNFIENVYVFSPKNIAKFLERGKAIGEEINSARELANTPGGDMTPAKLAEAAITAGKKYHIKVKVLGEDEIKKLGMGGILGVSQGSAEPPRFIIMEYRGTSAKRAPVVLIGKGITFDSGGLNLKSSEGIYEMHMDMSGGAAVIHIISALARVKAKRNVVGLIPAAENMPSGGSYRPGDVLKTMSGKTIEVLNTDAEGRVVLADGLEYAKKYKPRLVIDIATLTGAAMTGLGKRTSAILSTERNVENALREIGDKTMDRVWPLPLWEEYEEDIKGTFGDWANSSKVKYGGAITGAVFLWQFIKDYPWVHLDIAPRMTTIDGDYLAKGAAGASVNLLVHFLEKF